MGGDAELLGVYHGVEGPADDVVPLVVAVAGHGSERLLGDDFGQDDVVVGLGPLEALGVESGLVGGVHIAAPGLIGLVDLVAFFKGDELILHAVGAEEVGDIELGGGAGVCADGDAVQFQGAGDADFFGHEHSLSVVVVDAGEFAVGDVAAHGPGGVAGEDVDFAGLEGGEALFGGKRCDLEFGGVAEDGGGDGAAQVHIQPGPVAGVVEHGKAGQSLADAALDESLGADVLQSVGEGRGGERRGDNRRDDFGFHGLSSSLEVVGVWKAINYSAAPGESGNYPFWRGGANLPGRKRGCFSSSPGWRGGDEFVGKFFGEQSGVFAAPAALPGIYISKVGGASFASVSASKSG